MMATGFQAGWRRSRAPRRRQPPALTLALSCLALLLAGRATADPQLDTSDVLFDDIPSVYSASKFEQKTTDAPASVSVITSEDIARQGYRTLGEALNGLAGFYLRYDRNYTYLGVRGFSRPGDYNGRILVLIDGQRLNDPLYSQAGIGNETPIDLELIDRIEVVRGPGSSLYGTGAFFGVVNVITKRGRDFDGGLALGELGGFGEKRGLGAYGSRLANGVEFLVSASSQDIDGPRHLYYPEFDAPETNDGVAIAADGERTDRVFASLGYNGFQLEAFRVTHRKDVPTASYESSFNADNTWTRDTNTNLGLRYDGTIAGDVGLAARTSVSWYDYEGNFLYDDPTQPSGTLTNHDLGDTRWIDLALELRKRVFDRHQLVTGFEVNQVARLQQENYDLGGVYMDDDTDGTIAGLFVHDEIELSPDLRAVAGLRYDQDYSGNSAFSPRASVVYRLQESTFLKALFGQAFRAPNGSETHYEDLGTQKSPDELDPEIIRTYELVIEHTQSERLRGSLSLYRYDVRNLITLVTDPQDDLLVFSNSGSVTTTGLELSVEGELPGAITASTSYSFQKSHDSDSGGRPANSPSHLVKLSLERALFGPFRLALATNYESPRETVYGSHTRAIWLTNLTLLAKPLPYGFALSASLYNALDAEIAHPGGEEHTQAEIPQDGRSFRIQLSKQF